MSANPPISGIVPRDVLRGVSGIEFLRGMMEGRFPAPPIAVLLGFAPVELEAGRVVFASTPEIKHYNPIGSVHGGYTATLLDSCMACAVHTMLEAGQGYTTLELKVNFVKAITAKTGEVRAEGKVIHAGRQTAIAEGRLVDSRGQLLAHATTTCLIFGIPGETDRA
jgi:uncharacterized protein (TIGR00369 family)